VIDVCRDLSVWAVVIAAEFILGTVGSIHQADDLKASW
jgi:hypothetical protein